MVFLLTVVLASSFITIQSSRPTQAESLLYRVTCVVRGLLLTDCPTTTQTTPPPEQPQTTSPADTSPSGNNPSTSPVAPTQNGGGMESIDLDATLTTELPGIPEVPSSLDSTNNLVFPGTRGVTTASVGVLGARDTTPLSATQQGWSIYGVPWYWWLLTLGGMVGLYFGAKLFIDKLFRTVVN